MDSTAASAVSSGSSPQTGHSGSGSTRCFRTVRSASDTRRKDDAVRGPAPSTMAVISSCTSAATASAAKLVSADDGRLARACWFRLITRSRSGWLRLRRSRAHIQQPGLPGLVSGPMTTCPSSVDTGRTAAAPSGPSATESSSQASATTTTAVEPCADPSVGTQLIGGSRARCVATASRSRPAPWTLTSGCVSLIDQHHVSGIGRDPIHRRIVIQRNQHRSLAGLPQCRNGIAQGRVLRW